MNEIVELRLDLTRSSHLAIAEYLLGGGKATAEVIYLCSRGQHSRALKYIYIGESCEK